MNEIPQQIEDNIKSMVLSDLEPSAAMTYTKTGVAMLTGGLVSMFFCGQFGIGFTEYSQQFNHILHHRVGDIGCAMICGATFAVLPLLVLPLNEPWSTNSWWCL